MSQTFKLVNRMDPERFGKYMDWNFSPEGSIEEITGKDKLGQELLKIIMCGRTPWGYGTLINQFVGLKNEGLLSQGAISREVLDAIAYLRGLQLQAGFGENMNDDEIISVASKVKVFSPPSDPTFYSADVEVMTEDDQTVSVREAVL